MKILVGCPTYKGYAYCLQQYLDRVRSLTYSQFDLVLVDNSEDDTYAEKMRSLGITVLCSPFVPDAKERIVQSRNLLRQYALDHGYDYFLSLEQDILPPPDVIERFLRHEKKIVTGVYFKLYALALTAKGSDKTFKTKKKILAPVLFKFTSDPHKMEICTIHDVKKPQLLKVRASGLGCMLIHRSVLEKIPFRVEPELDAFDDVLFCSDLYEQGFELYADTTALCKHLILKKDVKMFDTKETP